jgi:glycine/D-amino acid oxidase-like deaminating enzyme
LNKLSYAIDSIVSSSCSPLGLSSLAEARPESYWLDRADRPDPEPPLAGPASSALAIVGGGYTGLWAALLAKERDPGRDVILVEADCVAEGASGRNGGFAQPSLTHGILNGLSHFQESELETLERLGEKNWDEFRDTLERHEVRADLEENGALSVAAMPWCVEELGELAAAVKRFGGRATELSGKATRAEIDSPTFLASVWEHDGGILDPARLAFGLLEAVKRLGVRVFEHTSARDISRRSNGVRIRTDGGRIDADRAILATNAFRSPLVRMRRGVIPVWDYVLVTEPLSERQLGAVGWRNRQGLSDTGNRFHYSRLTADNRILWGGYDAIYYYGSSTSVDRRQRPATFERLARDFYLTFPQLEDLGFAYKWGGPIATTTRFCLDTGVAMGGRVAWSIGYTGLGVVASRFGAQVALDRLDRPDESYLGLEMLRRRPFPWPPEPFRWAAVQWTRRALQRADTHDGRRGPWLKLLDALGLGFNS